jgi:hypothetical protein
LQVEKFAGWRAGIGGKRMKTMFGAGIASSIAGGKVTI